MAPIDHNLSIIQRTPLVANKSVIFSILLITIVIGLSVSVRTNSLVTHTYSVQQLRVAKIEVI